MTISELLTYIKEHKLSKEQLDECRDDMAHLFALMQIEMANIKKAKAFFIIDHAEKTNVATQNKWAVTDNGQREIQIKHELDALKEVLSSLKHRIYTLL